MRQKEIKIEWKPKKSRISQIYSDGLEYAFVTEDNKQINQMVYCKDFMQDLVLSYLQNKKISIYSFVYDPSVDLPLCKNYTKLIVSNSRDKKFKTKIPACLDFLNQIETKFKMKKTVINECVDSPKPYDKAGVWLVEGSKRWMQAPPLLSLYTLLIRVGFSHKKGQSYEKTINDITAGILPAYQDHDSSFLKNAQKAIDWIAQFGDRRLFYKKIEENYPKVGVFEMHNDFGIVGYSQGNLKHKMPHWYRLQGK